VNVTVTTRLSAATRQILLDQAKDIEESLSGICKKILTAHAKRAAKKVKK
jgi:hypothetical protein